jgi:hypothetical protein
MGPLEDRAIDMSSPQIRRSDQQRPTELRITMDSATFSAGCRQTLHVRKRLSPSFHSLVWRSKVRGGRRDAELRDGRTRRGEPQLRVVDKVADKGDDGLACHRCIFSWVRKCVVLQIVGPGSDKPRRRFARKMPEAAHARPGSSGDSVAASGVTLMRCRWATAGVRQGVWHGS